MNENERIIIGQQINKIRVNRKETLEEFANAIKEKTNFKVKTTKSNVSKWENGMNIPNDVTLKAISELGNISIDELIYGDLENYARKEIESLKLKLLNDSSVDNALIDSIVLDVYLRFFHEYAPPINEIVHSKEEFDTKLKGYLKDSIQYISNPEERATYVLGELQYKVNKAFDEYLDYFKTRTYSNESTNELDYSFVESMPKGLYDEIQKYKHEVFDHIGSIKDKYKKD